MKRIPLFLFIILSTPIFGQFDHEPVLPTLDGQELHEALINNYKTNTVLTYSQARDTFMRNIDAVDNILECVYTGFQVTLDPNDDPTIVAFAQGINTEHTYPRSKGASEGTNAYSDMHHLFPTKENVNSDRGSLIFQDIADNQTDKWYINSDVMPDIPSQNIDGYSESLTGQAFEPREKHKGDVARAYFYFYTMYQNQANNTAPNFFELQRETMCTWHFQDPVDEKEWNRNAKIAEYQDDKVNPFILDCRLARLYCAEIEGYCTSVSTKNVALEMLSSFPNPALNKLYFGHQVEDITHFKVLNASGQLVNQGHTEEIQSGLAIDISTLRQGIYIVQLKNIDGFTKAISRFVKI